MRNLFIGLLSCPQFSAPFFLENNFNFSIVLTHSGWKYLKMCHLSTNTNLTYPFNVTYPWYYDIPMKLCHTRITLTYLHQCDIPLLLWHTPHWFDQHFSTWHNPYQNDKPFSQAWHGKKWDNFETFFGIVNFIKNLKVSREIEIDVKKHLKKERRKVGQLFWNVLNDA